jgi:hypothetical protein
MRAATKKIIRGGTMRKGRGREGEGGHRVGERDATFKFPSVELPSGVTDS